MPNVDDLVRIRIAEAARRIAAARARREQLAKAREHGLSARHKAKLRRLDQRDHPPPEDELQA